MKSWNADFIVGAGNYVRKDGNSFYMDPGRIIYKPYRFTSSESFIAEEYIVIEYSAFGILRDKLIRSPFLIGINEKGETPLCYFNEMHIDGKKHRIIMKAEKGSVYTSLVFSIRIRAPHAYFKVLDLYTCSYEELPSLLSVFEEKEESCGFDTVSLSALYNSEASTLPMEMDGGINLPVGKTTVLGIPFEFSGEKTNVIAPAPAPAENNDEIVNFGVKTTRGLCRPISRDDKISVPICSNAKEILFVAGLSGMLYERWGFCAPDPTILGSAMGEVMMPLLVRDVEQFRVRIVYENGLEDIAFPYNVSRDNYRMSGALGVYAVPVSDYAVKEVVFENRMLETDVSIFAVSVNRAAKAVIPAVKEKNVCEPRISEKTEVSRNGNVISFVSGALSATIDATSGLRIASFDNGYAKESVASGNLLKIRTTDDRIITEFDTEILSLEDNTAVVKCKYEALESIVTIGVRNDTLDLSLAAKNIGSEKLSCGIIFPAIDNVSYSDFNDTWYLVPKYQNALGNGHISVYEESAPSFPMQFMDIFSETQCAGLGLLTKEEGLIVRKYGFDKNDNGASAYVEYPAMYMKLEPGESFTSSPAELFVHKGDWHFTFEKYCSWLKTWYKPVKSQNKSWYRKSYWLLAEITDFYETESFTRFPIWYEKDKKKHNFMDIMEEQKSIYGVYPDILHMWMWTWDEKRKGATWGHYGDEDYELVGGLEPWKAALRDCSEKTGANISLYLHPTLLTRGYPEEKEYMPDFLVERADGTNISLNGQNVHMRMCHANERWRNHILDMYERVYREIGRASCRERVCRMV